MRSGLGTLAVAVLLVWAPSAGAVIPAGNLVQNPGAEAAPGATNATDAPAVPGWATTPSFTAVTYGNGGFPAVAVSDAYGGGLNFFAGGPSNASSTAQQDIDVSGAAPEIGAGNVHAVFSAHLGGFAGQNDAATGSIQFLDAGGNFLAGGNIGPVTFADREGDSVLLPRTTALDVPRATRTIRVVIQATRESGTYNDGYADNVVVELARGDAPVFTRTVDAALVSGTVLVRLPRARRFVSLETLRTIPVGATIDARRGRVRLTTSDGAGRAQSSEFYEGVFKVFQRRRDRGVVELALAGGNFRRCPQARGAQSRKTRSVRRLWGSGSGKFRTKGRFAAATLRGTTWLTDDRCDGTQISVTQGAVNVRDIPKRQTVTVRAPNQYLAVAPRRRR